jgi:DNA-directed RNA polymerase II subunit RPB1
MASQQDVSLGRMESIQFGILSGDDILDISRVHVVSQDPIESGKPKAGGPLDYRMGTCDRTVKCQSCLGNNKECMGHFGHIDLAKPVFQVGFIQQIIDVLRCVCPHCSRLLLSRRDRAWRRIMTIQNPATRFKVPLSLGSRGECIR